MIAKRSTRVCRGFTLIELLVVIAVISLLVGILLPALGKARQAARDLKCQINQRSIAQAIQLYLDDQKDPRFFDLYPRSPLARDHWYAMVVLNDYLSGASESGVFVCPIAKGDLSVTDPTTRAYLESGARFFVRDYDDDGVDEFTEYFFNDSRVTTFGNPPRHSGVSNQFLRGIKHPAEVVWLTDAYDEVPRHGGKNYFTFGDQRIVALRPDDYLEAASTDKYGAPGPFYNWGHYYP
jgi:prepilin-type N-terminal cleavage/methylation domain-containing protein